MFIKPIKSYGKEYKCQIYKKYTLVNNQVLSGKIATKYVSVRIVDGKGNYRTTAFYAEDNSIHYATYYESVMTYANSKPENWVDLTKVGQSAIFVRSNNDKYIITLKKLPSDLSAEDPVIECKKLDTATKANLVLTKNDGTKEFPTTLINQYELNKYYLFKSMAYMPIDDIQDTEEQYIKGNVMKSQSRVIRFDIENELEIRDIVVLDNEAYIVEDITTHTKIGMYMYKTYTATLMKLGA